MMKIRRGFTLVELLIVIVIIGILASAMLLSSASATASAEASNIVSDLRSMKAGALMLYADSMDAFSGSGAMPAFSAALLAPYVDNPMRYTMTNTPYILTISGTKWWVGYDMDKGNKNNDVRQKLQGRAGMTGLLKSKTLGDTYSGGSEVFMVAR